MMGELQPQKRYITAVAVHTKGMTNILDRLYANTMIVASGQGEYFDGMILLVRSSVNPDHLAKIQTDRLFDRYAVDTHETLDGAVEALRTEYGIQVETT